eukprot:maker-scaffold893_size84343-snap-gene-0.24 protein:Tk04549 transcript:maker-scaffold893_size84343-snap-gene-0.24-mRNA-1 annotation:"beta- -endoglucanase"
MNDVGQSQARLSGSRKGKMKLLLIVVLSLAVLKGSWAQYNYGDALAKSLMFYEAQRSGKLPSSNRIPWRGDSATGDEIVGGYYDAGDHVKFGFPFAFTVTTLAWGAITFKGGYDSAGQTDFMKDNLKWATDYLVKAHKSKFELVGQIGDGDADHAYWGRPEDMTMSRPSFKITQDKPGSELAGESAAALAAASIFYGMVGDNSLKNECLDHARDLFEFADTYRGKYTDSIPQASNFYNSWSGFNDELAWAAAWMHKATGEDSYLKKAEKFYNDFSLDYTAEQGLGWDDKTLGVQALLFDITGKDVYKNRVGQYLDFVKDPSHYTPKGFCYLTEWGSLRQTASQVHLLLQVATTRGFRVGEIENFAKTQINYMLGDTGRSFVIGFGDNWPQKPHHRMWPLQSGAGGGPLNKAFQASEEAVEVRFSTSMNLVSFRIA